MANVLFSRTDSPSTKPITDGQIIFDTSGNGKMYLDNGTTRLEMGGAINVDATLDATSTNPIQNKGVAGVMLSELEEVRGVTKKGFLTDALATKTLDAKIGTTDISSIGDGTVTGAISDVNGKLGNESFSLQLGTSAITPVGTITSYDKASKMVFIAFAVLGSRKADEVIYVVPEKYRPSNNVQGVCILKTSGGDVTIGSCSIRTNGYCVQTVTNAGTNCIMCIFNYGI